MSSSERVTPVVRVNRKGADRIRSGHLWIFTSDVEDRGSAEAGDAVEVRDPKGRVVGTAHYSSSSQIALRFLSSAAVPIDSVFLRSRLEAALRHRQLVVHHSDAYRLVHAEGDLLPGLIVDRYADWLVMQQLDQGMDRLTPVLLPLLQELLQPKGIVARNDSAVRTKEQLPLRSEVLAGDVPSMVTVCMNGLQWNTDLLHGQKTGLFLDQRENYDLVRQFAKGNALDCFTASGGFALHMAGQCDSVQGLDSSAPILRLAEANARQNSFGNVSFVQADVLQYLPSLVSAKRHFDVVVVDPPAFAKGRGALEGAARGYKEINLRALRLLQRDGILVSCSCSHHMSEGELLQIIAAAALDTGKRLRILKRSTQASDHPILLTVPETHYLKCLIFQVL